MTAAGGRRVVVHDYSGHPFQLQLSRWLAARGHEVLHLYSTDVETPRGVVGARPGDPPGFACEGVGCGSPLPKYNPWRRWRQERDYARRLAARLRAFAPDTVLSTGPPDIQAALLATCRRMGTDYICWLQDVYGLAAEPLLRTRYGLAGLLAARLYRRREMAFLRRCPGIVAITEDFRAILRAEGVAADRVAVIPNWAPLEDLPVLASDNAWAAERGIAGKFVFLYSGTLGLKHDPEMLAALAERHRDDPEVRIVVVSQGLGRSYLEAERSRRGLANLLLLDYQPFERLPEVMAAATVLVALLEPFAGVLSVPSKVYSYLTARRPILAAVPASNLAARTLAEAGAALTLEPGDREGFLAAAGRLRDDPDLRARLADAGRRHAEAAFDIDRIGRRFLEVFPLREAGR